MTSRLRWQVPCVISLLLVGACSPVVVDDTAAEELATGSTSSSAPFLAAPGSVRWTQACEAHVSELADASATAVVAWSPGFEQALGDLPGGLPSPLFEPACLPFAHLRYVELVNGQIGSTSITSGFAAFPLLSDSLAETARFDIHEIPSSYPAVVSDAAPAAPDYKTLTLADCTERELAVPALVQQAIESLNTRGLAQTAPLDGLSVLDELLSVVVDDECEPRGVLEAIAAGAANADALSATAAVVKWDLIGVVRDPLAEIVLGRPALSLRATDSADSQSHVVVLSVASTEPVTAVAVTWMPAEAGRIPGVVRGQIAGTKVFQTIRPGSDVAIDTGAELTVPLEISVRWTERTLVIRSETWLLPARTKG